MELLNAVSFEEIVENDGQPCLVILSRKTCSVCMEAHTILEDVMQDYAGSGFGFYCVDAEEEADLFRRFQLKGVPQVLFFDGGIQKSRLSGRIDKNTCVDEIEKYID